jgi:hypothetical protein
MLGPKPDDLGQDYDAFAPDPPFRARRNPARFWTMMAVLAALLMLGALAAVSYFGVPVLGGGANAATQALSIQKTREPDRTRLESGNELLTVYGRVLNRRAASSIAGRYPPRLPSLRAARAPISTAP